MPTHPLSPWQTANHLCAEDPGDNDPSACGGSALCGGGAAEQRQVESDRPDPGDRADEEPTSRTATPDRVYGHLDKTSIGNGC
jgi:hypothetical protein